MTTPATPDVYQMLLFFAGEIDRFRHFLSIAFELIAAMWIIGIFSVVRCKDQILKAIAEQRQDKK